MAPEARMVGMTERERRISLNLSLEVSGSDVSGAPFVEATRSLNLSGGGVLFETVQNLLVGSPVKLRILLPPALRKHFGGKSEYQARAVVCRVERFEGSAVSRVGARFLGETAA
jgi:PilZ domain